MFRADSRFEIHIPPFLEKEEGQSRQFQLVEQCFNVPLWHIQVLPRKMNDDDFQRWSCYLVARACDALQVLLSQEWEGVRLHVVLPQYMTDLDSISLARCTALWECEVDKRAGQPAWLFETDIGSFVDPEFETLDPTSVKKTERRWVATDGCKPARVR
jgi:hypothetical protein